MYMIHPRHQQTIMNEICLARTSSVHHLHDFLCITDRIEGCPCKTKLTWTVACHLTALIVEWRFRASNIVRQIFFYNLISTYFMRWQQCMDPMKLKIMFLQMSKWLIDITHRRRFSTTIFLLAQWIVSKIMRQISRFLCDLSCWAFCILDMSFSSSFMKYRKILLVLKAPNMIDSCWHRHG